MHIRIITVVMTENNFIEVHIEGGKGVQPLSVDNYDITENENYRKNRGLGEYCQVLCFFLNIDEMLLYGILAAFDVTFAD